MRGAKVLRVGIASSVTRRQSIGSLWAIVALLTCSVDDGLADGVAKSKQTIHVGVYVNQINSLSLKANSFEVDFIVWFRGHTDDFDPLETFDIVDGQIQSKTEVTKSKIGAKVNYASCRVIAKITRLWNVSRFPRDNHTLKIAIEDGSNEEFRVRYVADTENCATNPQLQVAGWTVGTPNVTVEQHPYYTNYGDTSLPTGNTSSYSQFAYSIPLVRPSWGYFVKLFFGLFVAAAIAFLAFFIRPGDARFALGVGAIFASVASQYINASHLPETHILTMADMLHIVAFWFIFLSLAESTLGLYLANSGRLRLARRLDWGSFLLLGGAYIGLSVWVVLCWGRG